MIISSPFAYAADIVTGLTGWWRLDETSGNKARDASGRGNTGTLYTFASPSTTASGWNPGKLDGALAFDGGSDYVSVGMTGINYEKMTVSFWVKFNNVQGAVGNSTIILGSRYWVNNNFCINQVSADYTVAFVVGVNSYVSLRAANGTPAFSATGEWYHFVYSYDSTQATWADALKIYVNGQTKAFLTMVGTPKRIQTTTPIKMGSGDSYWGGSLDDVRIYNRALTEDDAIALYHNGGPTRVRNAVIRSGVIH